MARPQKNNCDYFPHDNDMRNHVKVRAIRNKFTNGYAIWSMLLEYLTGSDGNTFEKTPLQMELLSGDFGVSVTEISDVVDYCIRLEMLFEKDGWIYSESLNERLSPVYEKRGKSKQLSAKQKRENGKFAGNNADNTVVSVTETPQIKLNKIEVNEIENNITAEPSEKPQKKYSDSDFKKELLQLGVTEEVASDWMQVRKKARAVNTETAMKKIKSELAKCKLTPNEAIKTAVEKSWRGFENQWIENEEAKKTTGAASPSGMKKTLGGNYEPNTDLTFEERVKRSKEWKPTNNRTLPIK